MSAVIEIEQTKLPGVLVITPKRFGDQRGFFCESWNKARMAEHGLMFEFVQDNHSLSQQVNTVRGLHYQMPPHAQAKLVRCGRGALLDVAVDIRKGSPTYAQWVTIELTEENGKQLLVPEGFAHGFVTLRPDTEIIYKCTDYYAPECDRAIAFDDREIGVDWGLSRDTAILSDKDAKAPKLSDADTLFIWEERA